MTVKRWITALLAVIGLALTALPAAAQDSGPEVIASGLNNPRGICFAPDGTLYIAESGTGGDTELPGPFGPIKVGATARVLSVPAGGGDLEQVLVNLPSSPNFGDMIGVTDVYASDDTLWLTLGIGPDFQPFNRALVSLDKQTLRVQRYVDLYGIEAETNPDEDDSSVASNPIGMARTDDGTIYVADASANAVYSWTADGGLKLFHAWTNLPVPTSVAVGPDGDVYVGFLSAFPYVGGAASVERWSVDGTLKETYGNLSFVTSVLVAADGSVYAVQLAEDADDMGFTPNSGSVVRLTTDGATPIAERLSVPYGLAQAPDGSFAVTINSAFSELGTGQVIRIGGAS